MAKDIQKKSNLPFIIIGVVLVVAVVAGAYFLRSKPTPASNTVRNQANAAKKDNTLPVNAPMGANPPHMAGSPTAVVTLEEFADFQCGACATVHPVMNDIKSLYGSKIKFIFRNFPLAMHDKAYDAAVAAEAAGMQGKFWDMQNVLFTNQQAWMADPNYKATWKTLATTIGLDVAKWEDDIRGMAARQRVNDDMARGRAASVSGTPALFLNGTFIEIGEMNVDTLKVKIDAELQKALAAQSQGTNKGQAPAQNQTAPAANAGNTSK